MSRGPERVCPGLTLWVGGAEPHHSQSFATELTRRTKERPKPPPRIKPGKEKANRLKGAKIVSIDYKDAALLRKFISDRGKIRARRVTGVTVQEQRQIANAVKNAREMALLPYSSSAR